jgi:rod shape determining protein RodA
VVILLIVFGIAMLYSAGQTDAPHQRGRGLVPADRLDRRRSRRGRDAFRISPRLLEWAAPGLYVLGILLLIVTLFIGTGAGSAAGTRSWLTIGGIRLGQPAELAKLATILLLARYLSTLREAPDSLRALVVPGLIAGVPLLLVLAQPDLGSAIVFAGILFAMLYWAGVRPLLLLLVASPMISLLLSADTRLWGAWMVVLALLLVAWRTYAFEGCWSTW